MRPAATRTRATGVHSSMSSSVSAGFPASWKGTPAASAESGAALPLQRCRVSPESPSLRRCQTPAVGRGTSTRRSRTMKPPPPADAGGGGSMPPCRTLRGVQPGAERNLLQGRKGPTADASERHALRKGWVVARRSQATSRCVNGRSNANGESTGLRASQWKVSWDVPAAPRGPLSLAAGGYGGPGEPSESKSGPRR